MSHLTLQFFYIYAIYVTMMFNNSFLLWYPDNAPLLDKCPRTKPPQLSPGQVIKISLID